MKKIFNKEQEIEICNMYQVGNTLAGIARIKNCDKATIRRVLHRNGLDCRKWSTSEEGKKKLGELSKKRWENGKMHSGMLGKYHSEETKQYMSEIKIGDKNPFWNGGIKRAGKKGNQYVFILCPNHPSIQGKTSKYVPEHRLVMEKHLGRYLKPHEIVHHKNGIKYDNRIENLEIVLQSTHYGKIICPHCNHEFLIK